MPIELKNVSYTYMQGSVFSHNALTDINLTLHENEFVAIIGHTGSGKSTLITHMNGLIQPTDGKVYADGIDLAEKSKRHEARKLVGMVFQYPEYQLFEETVAKDIAFGPRNAGMTDDQCDAAVREAMALVGLDYDVFAEKSPFELSGGEKRRAALAGIIAMKPKYLVLDEPMAGLDPQGRRLILETIKNLKERLHCAVIMISHSMDDVAKIAKRVIVLDKGSVIMDGTPQEVFADANKLKAIGLDVPTASTLSILLREKGIPVPSDICDMDTLAQYLTRSLKQC